MNITEFYDLNEIVQEIELALLMTGDDHHETDLDKVIENVRRRITGHHAINLVDFNLDSIELEMSQSREGVAIYLDNMSRLHAKLCGVVELTRFTKTNRVSLSDINYLGFKPMHVKSTLKAMQSKDKIPSVENNIQAIKGRLSSIDNCMEKRLLVIAVICHELGMDEMMSTIAELLWLTYI